MPGAALAQGTCTTVPPACTAPSAACVGTPVGTDIACQCFNNAAGNCRCCSEPSGGSPCTVECSNQIPVAPGLSTFGVAALLLTMLVTVTGVMPKRRESLLV